MERLAVMLVLGALLSSLGCAARSSGPARPNPTVQQPTHNSRWRGMSWAEYHDDVTDRARKRGTMVMWVNPPAAARPGTLVID